MRKTTGFLITSKGWGGLELNVLRLAQWFGQNGIRVILYTVPETRIFKEASKYNLSVVEIYEHRKYFDVRKAVKFGQMLKQHSVSNLMVFDNKDLDFANLVKLSLWNNLRLIYQQHMQIGISKKGLIHTFRFSGLDYWISPLEWLKQQVIKQTHVNTEKIKVIPLGVEIQKHVVPEYTKTVARQKLALKQNSFVVGIIGRIDTQKGQLFLVQAIKNIRTMNIPIELLIVGEPTESEIQSVNYLKQIQDYIKQENLSDVVHIKGYTSDVNLFYNAIDVFVLASKAETYGMVTIEAMLSGIPVIATNSAGTPEILEHGKLGTLYTPDDIEDFCLKLIYMYTHIEESLKQAEMAQTIAINKYSHQTECEMIEQLLAC